MTKPTDSVQVLHVAFSIVILLLLFFFSYKASDLQMKLNIAEGVLEIRDARIQQLEDRR